MGFTNFMCFEKYNNYEDIDKILTKNIVNEFEYIYGEKIFCDITKGIESKTRQDKKIIDLIKTCGIKEFKIIIHKIPNFILPYCKIIELFYKSEIIKV
jgi:hypothetical protein